MAYEFTKLSDVEIAEQPSDAANILIEDNGDIKKVPISSIGDNNDNPIEEPSASGSGVEVIDFVCGGYTYISNLEDVQRAMDERMTIHVIYTEDYDSESPFIHVSFPRFSEFCHGTSVDGINTYQAHQFALTGDGEIPIGFHVQADDEDVVTNAYASINGATNTYATMYATSI